MRTRIIIALTIAAGLIFAWVAFHEFRYAKDHGDNQLAEILGWVGAAGTCLSVALGLWATEHLERIGDAYRIGKREGVNATRKEYDDA